MATLTLRAVEDRVEFTVADTAAAPWAESTFAEMKLTREETLRDPELQELFHVAEHVQTEYRGISRYLGSH